MQIAARTGAWAKSGGGCPYVTDGLVAWFDSTVNPPTLENGWTNNANAADVRPVTQGLIDSSGALVFFLGNQRFVFADSLPQAPMTIQVVVFKYGGNGAIYDAQNDYFWWAWGGVCKSAYAGTRIGPPTWTVGKTLTYRVGDGIAAATMDAANGWNTTSANGGYLNVPIAFGYGWDGDQGLIGGRYKCLRIYNRALTDAEVIANEAADAARFPLDAPFAINDASGVVSSIGGSAFSGCAALASVGDLTACTSIGSSAFSGCTALASVGDLTACTSIGGSAFSGCTALTSVVDLAACTSIGSSAFRGCTALTSVGDLSSLTMLSYLAFASCNALTTIGDLSNCTEANVYAFLWSYNIRSLTFRTRTHNEVEGFNSFGVFSELGRSCIFHCSDGDFYSDGTHLLPVT